MSGSIRLPLAMLALAALAGCQTGRRYEHDPLMGGGPAVARQPAPSRQPDAGLARGDVPPVPPANSATSPAALTNGAVAAGDRRAPGEVVVHGPRPKDSRAAAPATEARAAPPAGDYEALQQQLQSRGVVWQQLRMVEQGRWDFLCAIPDPRQPNVRRNYEARARASAVEAMREVLEEIDNERR
jgi:hypothetical protein